MAKRVAITQLNATTMDILNTIRANASAEYQQLVPEVTKPTDVPRVGETICGYPALANQFVNALINRIAFVRVKSATYNNQYADLKKGFFEFGETIEEVFVNITKAREFSVEKAESREFKRSLPDVRSAFHCINWKVQYPITIQERDLQQAFLSIDGVQDLIARIVDAVYTAAEYDEFLLFKYLLIKAVSHGKMRVENFDGAEITNSAVAFRAMSNLMTFMRTDFNETGVHNVSPREDQYIFMDATFNATFDVSVLSAAFNMDKATFMGHLKLIDSFDTFDSDRFSVIIANGDQLEPVTDEELTLMKDVKAIIVDKEWFQVYDNNNKFTEKYVASGDYWNYFYNVWKTVATSPFSNAVAFVESTTAVVPPAQIVATIVSKSEIKNQDGTVANVVYALEVSDPVGLGQNHIRFIQTEAAVTDGIAVHPYGGIIVPAGKTYTPEMSVADKTYAAATAISDAAMVGDEFTFTAKA